ncbi:Mrpl17 protein [Candida orthopsilosis Co 90-125]|uniref:Large ribosomal subunit protein mL46 n=1 Tax=Candida orthopsilosis (strain 90-125) TaxID=1136231 RepID=H8X836_CANO9|nr:Mrpl17 protein [Candida orthopsilosis Co 90-125]CCG24135.1 Mrpl17 protein [Candida orthopsilosis Co 90-125]
MSYIGSRIRGPITTQIRCYAAVQSNASSSSTTSSPSISSTLILSRLPIITQDLTPFESQFYKYQSELWRRLMWTFPKWFYFKSGTMAELRYRQINKNPVSYNPKMSYPKGKPDLKHLRDRRFRQYIRAPKTYREEDEIVDGQDQSEFKENEISRKIIPASRITEADKRNDATSLERKLSRTLYLIIKDSKNENGDWKLPNFKESNENLQPLHVLAEEGLYELGGKKINYFNVSKVPCHHNQNKEYFIKSHILSGSFEPQLDSIQYQWATKEELKELIPKNYYSDISHLLSDV